MVANPKHGDNDDVADEEDLLQHRRTIMPHEVNSEVIILCCLLLRLDVMVVFVLKNVLGQECHVEDYVLGTYLHPGTIRIHIT